MRSDYRYPEHLKPYENLDGPMLKWASSVGEITGAASTARAAQVSRIVAPERWLTSAEARGLVERRDAGMRGRRWWEITEAGRQRLKDLAASG